MKRIEKIMQQIKQKLPSSLPSFRKEHFRNQFAFFQFFLVDEDGDDSVSAVHLTM